MKKIITPALVSALVLAGVQTGHAQAVTSTPAPEPIPAPAAEPTIVAAPVAEPAPSAVLTPIAESAPALVTEAAPAAAQTELAGPYRTDAVAVQPTGPACVRQV
ncbi:MAG TPA: hypothetical protein VFZ20_04680, partial [Longimicrobium sp.]|nr:hypothetical protein [Longimicrobium sp.]